MAARINWKLRLKGKTLPKGPVAVHIDDLGDQQATAAGLAGAGAGGGGDYPPSTNSGSNGGGATRGLEKERVHVPRGKRRFR